MKLHNVVLTASLLCFSAAACLSLSAMGGCAGQPVTSQAQTALTQAQAADNAAIAATAAAQKALAATPTTGPAQTQAEQALQNAQAIEAQANKVLATAQQAATAIQQAGGNAGQVLANPTVQQAAASAVGTIPSPWATVAAIVLPALMSSIANAISTTKQANAHAASVTALAGAKSKTP